MSGCVQADAAQPGDGDSWDAVKESRVQDAGDANLDCFRGEAKVSTWLYKIATNECITFLNRQRSNRNISLDDTDVFLLETLKSDEYFDGDELELKFQEAILKLPEKQRLVFTMKYGTEMKYEEMSEVLGTSVGALKASYHHAVKKIEAFLTEDG